MNYDELEIYRRNKSVAFDGLETWWVHRLCRKAIRIAARLVGRRIDVAFTDRLIEYPLLFQHLDLKPSQSHLLDFGCVEDLLPMHLCAMGYRVTGLDFRPYPFRHERFDFIQSDILSWQPPKNHFDAAISISTIEHVGLGAYGDPVAADGDKIAVAKLLDALKPAGRLILTVPAGRAVTTATMRIYDPARLRGLAPKAEVVRFFAKSRRHADWNEVGPERIADLAYEDYGAIGAAQSVAFVVVRKE
jgi:SAM-dependent methyltransferase